MCLHSSCVCFAKCCCSNNQLSDEYVVYEALQNRTLSKCFKSSTSSCTAVILTYYFQIHTVSRCCWTPPGQSSKLDVKQTLTVCSQNSLSPFSFSNTRLADDKHSRPSNISVFQETLNLNLSKCFPTGSVTSFQIPFSWCNEHSHMLVSGTGAKLKTSLQPVGWIVTRVRAAGSKNNRTGRAVIVLIWVLTLVIINNITLPTVY